MSDDLIKRSDAIKAVWGEDINPSEDGVVFEAQSHVDRDIRLIPSADRPQGAWFKDDDGTFICSACGSGYKDQPTLMGKPLFEWCPLCGAKMKV